MQNSLLPVSVLTRITVLVLAAWLAVACQPAEGETRELKVGDVTMTQNPLKPPRELKEYFHYPNGKLTFSTVYMAGSFLSTPEGALLYTTEDTPDQVIAHYTDVIEENEWTVIQTVNREDERLIMAESRFRKIVTVIVRGQGPSEIKVYFKRSDSD